MCEDSSGRRDRLLFELIEALGNSLSLHEIFAELEGRLCQLIAFEALAIWLPLDDRLVPAYVNGVARITAPLGSLLSAMAVTLEHNSSMVAELALYHREPHAFQEKDREMLLAIRRKAAAAIANALRTERDYRLPYPLQQ